MLAFVIHSHSDAQLKTVSNSESSLQRDSRPKDPNMDFVFTSMAGVDVKEIVS